MTSDRLSEEELVTQLEAKVWQSSSRRNSAFGLSKHSDHVCWKAAVALRASRDEIARLKSDISDYAEATTQQNAELDRVRTERDGLAEIIGKLVWKSSDGIIRVQWIDNANLNALIHGLDDVLSALQRQEAAHLP